MAITKELYELGELPPLGHVPQRMYASVIRPERYGPPKDAFATEVVDVPTIGAREVLVWVMAAGINYNNVWSSLGKPVDVIAARRRRDPTEPAFHIGGSDASGIVWAVGDEVTEVKVGDRVVLSCAAWDENAPDVLSGGDPIASVTTRIWGYELNWGSFAQFTRVAAYQCHRKPPQLSWEAAAAYMLVGATAYRQLLGWPPHVVGPGTTVLIWGGTGGLGSAAIQITKAMGGIPVAVVSSDERAEFCRRLGAAGVINRRDSAFQHWGRLPNLGDAAAMERWMAGANAFRQRWTEVSGSRRGPKLVLEHPGQETIPTSLFVCDNAGMVVICAGTTGYNADVDLRYLWMRQKRLQGSHFADVAQCRALNEMVIDGRVDPSLGETFAFSEVGAAHQKLLDNTHGAGNMAVLVNAKHAGSSDI